MIIVGFSGVIGSGKSTLAQLLAANATPHAHWESWQIIAEVANGLRSSNHVHPNPADLQAINVWLQPLPQIVERITRQNMPIADPVISKKQVAQHPERYVKLFEYLALMQKNPVLAAGPVAQRRKERLRSLLQWLGGYLAKTVSGDIWYAEIVRRMQATPNLQLATVGGVRFPADAAAIKLAGGYIISIERPSIDHLDSSDITEREIGLVAYDALVINDGTIEQMVSCAKDMYADLLVQDLKATYKVSSYE